MFDKFQVARVQCAWVASEVATQSLKMDCCGYLLFVGPAARNLAKRLGRECVECCVRGSQRLRNKLAPKHACPCDLLAMMPPDGELLITLSLLMPSPIAVS